MLGEGLNYIRVYLPDDLAAVGLVVHDIFPWRGPEAGGTPFEIGGVGFGSLGNTTVTFDGIPATLFGVSPNRIRGVTPANLAHDGELVDIEVTVGAASSTLTGAFRYLYPAGNEPGWWEADLPEVPAFLGEVAAGVIDGILYLVGEGAGGTYRYDILGETWLSNAAGRPFVGHPPLGRGGRRQALSDRWPGRRLRGPRADSYDPVGDSWSLGTDMSWAGGSGLDGRDRRQDLRGRRHRRQQHRGQPRGVRPAARQLDRPGADAGGSQPHRGHQRRRAAVRLRRARRAATSSPTASTTRRSTTP